MPTATIDHITITCTNLQDGADFVEQALGVRPQRGGEHPRMGTHNLLLRLGEALFLEVIAIDPLAKPPGRPRWFALDNLGEGAAPRLSNWVAGSSDIVAARAAAAPFADLGDIEAMSRGARTWRITIPGDGGMPLDGIAPALIAWDADPHPAAGMPEAGLRLHSLELFHPEPERVRGLLAAIGMQAPATATATARVTVSVAAPPPGRGSGLVAHIATPAGIRTIGL